jgi:uncharacterized protein (DUF488 family)
MALLYTIGHSTRSSEEFVELLRQNDIRILVDARSWPNSRRYPHFNRDNMARTLEKNGVRYERLGEQLGEEGQVRNVSTIEIMVTKGT